MSFNTKKTIKITLPIIFVAIFIFLILQVFFPLSSLPITGNNTTAATSKPLSTQKIDKTFNFPLKNNDGEDIATFSYTIQSAELRDEIIVKGQKATAAAGRQFLIINIKMINSLDQGLQINSRDYIRLAINNNETEWLAPEIHNDPVEVQAISTKYTRVGFPVNITDTHFVLQIGEINGNKQKIQLNFK